MPLFMGKSDVKEVQESTKEYAQWLLEGYGDSISLEQVAKGTTWRKDFMLTIMEILKDSSTNDGLTAYLNSLINWDKAGMFDFSFLN